MAENIYGQFYWKLFYSIIIWKGACQNGKIFAEIQHPRI